MDRVYTMLLISNEFLPRLLLAIVCGSVIGAERQWRQRGAGLRTNVLVAVGACLFIQTAEQVPGLHGEAARIASYVVSGIGFLCGGVIMRDGQNVRGLNTAATLWCVAAIGVLCGVGLLPEAVAAAFVILGANVLLRGISSRIDRQPVRRAEVELSYQLRVTCLHEEEVTVRALLMSLLQEGGLMLQSLHSRDLPADGRIEVCAELVTLQENQPLLESIVARVSLTAGVSAVGWSLHNA